MKLSAFDGAPLSRWLPAAAFVLSASCSSDSLESEEPKSAAPNAALIASPEFGVAPLSVQLDARGSSDDLTPVGELEFRFDVDGDGEWDSDWSREPSYQATLDQAGEFTSRVIVRDADRLESIAELASPIDVLPIPERGDLELVLIGDLNHDATLDTLDEAILGQTTDANAFSVFGPNLDDDDGDGRRDGIDEVVNGENDIVDLAPLKVPAIRGFEPGQHQVMATIRPEAARDWIRIFSDSNGYPVLNTVGVESFELDLDFREDQYLLFEGIIGRFQEFDGQVEVQLELKTLEGEVLSQSSFNLVGAPVIFPPIPKMRRPFSSLTFQMVAKTTEVL